MWILLCIPQRNFTTTIILFTSFPLPKINPKAIFLSTPFECEQIHFSRWAVNKSFVPYRIAFHASSENMYLWNDAGFSAKFSTNRLYNQFAVWVSCAFFLTPTQKLTSLWLENIFVICNDQFARSETTVIWSKLFVWLFVCWFYWQLRIRCVAATGKKSILFASLLGEYEYYSYIHASICTICHTICVWTWAYARSTLLQCKHRWHTAN